MLDYKVLYDKVREHFLLYNKEERFNHSIRVGEMGLTLNKIHNLQLDEELIKISALLHDYAKVYEDDILKKYIITEFPNDYEVLNYPEIHHALVGDIIVKEKLKIQNIEVLDAIKYHTTGKENMSNLTKLIYLADYIEEGRTFKMASIIREIAFISLDKAISEMTKNVITYLENKGVSVYSMTYETYNYYKKESLNA